jgi:hypothetical protein
MAIGRRSPGSRLTADQSRVETTLEDGVALGLAQYRLTAGHRA